MVGYRSKAAGNTLRPQRAELLWDVFESGYMFGMHRLKRRRGRLCDSGRSSGLGGGVDGSSRRAIGTDGGGRRGHAGSTGEGPTPRTETVVPCAKSSRAEAAIGKAVEVHKICRDGSSVSSDSMLVKVLTA